VKKRTFLILLLSLTPFFLHSQQNEIIYSDNFDSYQNGAIGAPTWQITKGNWLVDQGKFFQKSVDYDCVAMLKIFFDFSFRLEFKFRVIEGEPGVGVVFCSERSDNTSLCQMNRFQSNETMLIGRFMNGEYDCQRLLRFKKEKFARWFNLILIVDTADKKYSMFLNKKPLVENEPLLFRAGYCGLQSSGGVIAFDDVKVTKLSPGQQPSPMTWLRFFIFDHKDQIVYPQSAKGVVEIANNNGQVISALGKNIEEKGQLKTPLGIAQLSCGDYVIGDSALNRLHLFSEKGKWKKSVGYKGTGNEQFAGPVDVCTDSENRIFVADRSNKRIQVLNKKLDFLFSFGREILKEPVAIYAKGDSCYVADNGVNRIFLFTSANSFKEAIQQFDFGNGQAHDILYYDHKIYLTVEKELRQFEMQGKWSACFRAEALGDFNPWGLACNKGGDIYVSDFASSRLLELKESLFETQPVVKFPANRKALINVQTLHDTPATLQIFHGEKLLFDSTSSSGFFHIFEISNLSPSTVYSFHFSPTIDQIPKDTSFSKKYFFMTPAPEGKKHYRSLEMATIIFTNVVDTAVTKPAMAQPPELTDQEIERIKDQIKDGIRFYWVNSGLNLFLNNEFIIVRERLLRSHIFGNEWYYPPLIKTLTKYLRLAKKNPDNIQSVLYIACVQEQNKKGYFELRGRGGGFTEGLSANNKFGLSWWEATPANHSSGNNWLMVHEFHHQLDELFLLSGHPEYLFNHFSPTIGAAFNFGEHFDGNAWILKNWPLAKWFDLQFGELRFTADEDNDGVPDNYPALPLDEKRLGSSAQFADYDNDGETDLAELNFSNWICEGCGETYGGAARFPNLLNPDTDKDGFSDSDDDYPLYPFEPAIQFCETASDSAILNYPFCRLVDNRIHAQVFACWNNSCLCFIFKTDRLAPIKLMIDANADGWFLGRDNYRLYLTPQKNGILDSKVEMVNSAVPRRWPFHDDDLAKTIRLTTKLVLAKDYYLTEVCFPKNEYTGLMLQEKEKIGINVGFNVLMDVEGHERYVTVFEPNRFFEVVLQKSSR